MATRAQLDDRIISLLYEGVLSPAMWNDALSLLCVLMGCEQAALTTWDRETNLAGLYESVGLPVACRQQFVDHYCVLDPARDVMDRIHMGCWYRDYEIIGQKEMGRSAFYQDFLRGFGLASIVATPLLRDKFLECFLVFQYSLKASRRRQPGTAILDQLIPHMQRAMRLRRHFAEVEETALRNMALLESLRLPIVIVDANGGIICASGAAEALLAQAPGVTVCQRQVVCSGESNQKLQRLIRSACGRRPVGGGMMAPSSANASSTLQILVIPLPPHAAWQLLSSEPLAMVLIQEPNGIQSSHEALCQEIYALTPAEARVAIGIARGLTPKKLAQQAAVSLTTVRSQLSTVLQKTGSSRQGDLVRMLGALLLLR